MCIRDRRGARIVSGAGMPMDTLYLRCDREVSATSALSANSAASSNRPMSCPALRRRSFFFLRSVATAIPPQFLCFSYFS